MTTNLILNYTDVIRVRWKAEAATPLILSEDSQAAFEGNLQSFIEQRLGICVMNYKGYKDEEHKELRLYYISHT